MHNDRAYYELQIHDRKSTLLEFFHSKLNQAAVNNLLNDDFIYLSSSYIIIIIILKKTQKQLNISIKIMNWMKKHD